MTSVQTSSYDGRYLKLTVIEESYSIPNNTSTVRWTLESIGGNSNYYSIYQWGVIVNGQTIYVTQNTEWNTYKFPAKKGSTTGTITIQHDPDGTAPNVTFTLKGNVYYNRSRSYSGSISLTPLHKPPTVIIDSVTELNALLTGLPNDTFVQYLSQKRFVLNAVAYDDAEITGYSVKNGNTIVNNTTATLDINIQELYIEANVVPIVASASDTLNSIGSVQQNYSNYILYQKPTIEPTSTTTKRNGQTSGRCLLNVVGNYWEGQIGNTTNVLVVKYRYWEKGTTEPSTWEIVPSANVVTNNGRVTVTDYEIGTNDTTQSNYFDYQKAYNIRVQIEDNYYSDNTLKGITVGEAVWSEYKDRVDFIRATIKGEDISIIETGNNANGEYIKFSNGLLICTNTIEDNYVITTVWGSLYEPSLNSTAGSTTFPIPFVSKPNLTATQVANGAGGILRDIDYDENGIYRVNFSRPNSSSSTILQYSYIAIGLWK